MGVQSCEESTVAVQFTMKAFVAVLSCLAVAAAKPSLVAQAPLAYNYGYNGLINTAYAGYAAPAVAHAGVYAAPIAVNPYAYANAYPAAEPYIHQEILAEPYIHQEPIAAPVAVAAAPVAYAAAPVAYAAAAPVAAATYAAAAPVATATYGYTTPIATAAYAPAAYSGYYAAAPAVAVAKHH